MTQKIWSIIEETKVNNQFTDSENHSYNLIERLSKFSNSEINEFEEQWRKIYSSIMGDEFEKLHINNGGIVSSGDDGFYMDFANWLIAQGVDLYKKFKENGHTAVLDYIKENDISKSNYMYESMIYCFDLARERKK